MPDYNPGQFGPSKTITGEPASEQDRRQKQARDAEAEGRNILCVEIGRVGQPGHGAPTGPNGNRSEAEYRLSDSWGYLTASLTSTSPIPKVSKKPCFPNAVMITARLCLILSVQPRSR